MYGTSQGASYHSKDFMLNNEDPTSQNNSRDEAMPDSINAETTPADSVASENAGYEYAPSANAGAQSGSVETQKKQRPHHTQLQISSFAVRIAYLIVFIVNLQCAIGFLAWPGAYAPSYELSGIPGDVAVRGMGLIFLMWNVTYPLVIISPRRFRILGVVVLVQQVIGLIGESWILSTLPAGHDALQTGIERFASFDAIGLVIMLVTFVWFCIVYFFHQHSKAGRAEAEQKNAHRNNDR